MRRTRLLIALLAAAAVLTAGVTVLATRGLGDAVMMIGLVVALAGGYLLRHHARAVLIYRRPPLPTDGHGPPATHRSPAHDTKVMTTEVITASDDASIARVAAVPIADRFDVVVGVMSPPRSRSEPTRGGPADAPPRRRVAAGDRPAGRLAGIVTRWDLRLDAVIREEVAHRTLMIVQVAVDDRVVTRSGRGRRRAGAPAGAAATPVVRRGGTLSRSTATTWQRPSALDRS
jgi:hypothetical protein